MTKMIPKSFNDLDHEQYTQNGDSDHSQPYLFNGYSNGRNHMANSEASSLSVRSLYIILVMSCKRIFRTIWTFKGVALISSSELIVLCIGLLFVLRRLCHTFCVAIVCHSMAVQYGT